MTAETSTGDAGAAGSFSAASEEDAAVGPLAVGLEALFTTAPAGPPLLGLDDLGSMSRAIARRPGLPLVAGLEWASDMLSILRGRGADTPLADRRYRDTAWTQNVLLRVLGRAHEVTEQALVDLVEQLSLTDRDRQRLHFVVTNIAASLSPANTPLLNPAALKTAVDRGGANYLDGARRLMADLWAGRRAPPSVAEGAFSLGHDVASTPGAVVMRTPVLELLHYRPAGDSVHETPILIAPSIINKYYIFDLTPQKSVVGHLLEQGHDVFVVSYLNPDARDRHLGLDAYVESLLRALDAVRSITGAAQTHLCGICAGAIIASAAVGWLAAAGRQSEIAGLTMPVAVLAPRDIGVTGSLIDERTLERAVERARGRGYVDGLEIGDGFPWLRPVEGIWVPAISRYLLADPPLANELLFWVADAVNVTAAIQRDLAPIVLRSALMQPGGVAVLGEPIDLSQVEVPTYGLGGIADYMTPWQGCLRSLTAMAGPARFALAPGGHLSALLPDDSRPQSHRVGPVRAAAADWESTAEEREGSWWGDWSAWLLEASSSKRPAPRELGSDDFPEIDPAPGRYVHRRIR